MGVSFAAVEGGPRFTDAEIDASGALTRMAEVFGFAIFQTKLGKLLLGVSEPAGQDFHQGVVAVDGSDDQGGVGLLDRNGGLVVEPKGSVASAGQMTPAAHVGDVEASALDLAGGDDGRCLGPSTSSTERCACSGLSCGTVHRH